MPNLSHFNTAKKLLIASLLPAALLTGCGGGSSSSSSSGTGALSVSLTDAPIDSAQEVWVQFTGVSVRQGLPEGDETEGDPQVEGEEAEDDSWLEFTFDEPKDINLLDLQGTQRVSLLAGEELPAGTYTEIRLHVNAVEDSVFDSYIVLNNAEEYELDIPSGSTSGLKVKGDLVIPENGEAAFTIDFDVRKSIVAQGNGEYKLKPVLRIEQDDSIGHISGTVDAALFTEGCAVGEGDYGSVYVYSGGAVTPVDYQGTEADPITSALVSYDAGDQETPESYRFEVGYLPASEEGVDYTVAFTCDADLDTVDAADPEGTVNFEATEQPVSVLSGQTTEVSLEAPVPEEPAPEEPAPEEPAPEEPAA